ncbi:MAG: hypothetical protein P1R58_12465 [bacterium]|nr:hypothetical protein [bacterium]
MNKFPTLFVIIFTFLFLPLCALGEELTVQTASGTFVDLDGDGIDDAAMDANEDGIPDACAFGYVAPRQDLSNMTLNLPSSVSNTRSAIDMAALNSLQRFGQRQFCIRAQEKCRSSLDAQFSAGIGVGVGSAGGVCAGGVCF